VSLGEGPLGVEVVAERIDWRVLFCRLLKGRWWRGEYRGAYDDGFVPFLGEGVLVAGGVGESC
jgi:hypothetical protein